MLRFIFKVSPSSKKILSHKNLSVWSRNWWRKTMGSKRPLLRTRPSWYSWDNVQSVVPLPKALQTGKMGADMKNFLLKQISLALTSNCSIWQKRDN